MEKDVRVFADFMAHFGNDLQKCFRDNVLIHVKKSPALSGDGFLTSDEFVQIFNSAVFKQEDVGVYKDGNLLPYGALLAVKSEEFLSVNNSDLDKNRIAHAIHSGFSIKINQLQRWSAGLMAFAKNISAATSSRASFNTYYTPPHEVCFKPHRDNQWNFVMQVKGSKQWYVGTKGEDATKDSETLILNEGDILFIPKNMSHFAESRESSSLHVTVALLPNTLHDFVLETLRDEELAGLMMSELSPDAASRSRHIKTFLNILADKLQNPELAAEFCRRVPYGYDVRNSPFMF